jgi:hypothetical protein
MNNDDLPRFIQDIISAGCPKAGEGVNNWLFKTARLLHEFRSTDNIFELLKALSYGCGRTVTETEISRAINNSYGCRWIPGQHNPLSVHVSKWPLRDEECIERLYTRHETLADMCDLSPIHLDYFEVEDIIDILFPLPESLLCCGKSTSEFRTLDREDWRGKLAHMPLIVPSPMTARYGVTKEGKKSQHTLNNTGPRRYLVTEFDAGTLDQQSKLIGYLEEIAPLTLVVHSGCKSLHAWFYCRGRDEEMLYRFMATAVSIGADPATWLRSQFVRMPGAMRPVIGKRQEVFYFNPETIKDVHAQT